MARKRSTKFIKRAIRRPGALTRKSGGKVTAAKARKLAKSGDTTTKRQALFYLNVLRPASRRRRKKS